MISEKEIQRILGVNLLPLTMTAVPTARPNRSGSIDYQSASLIDFALRHGNTGILKQQEQEPYQAEPAYGATSRPLETYVVPTF
jgi:hypothetical protein